MVGCSPTHDAPNTWIALPKSRKLFALFFSILLLNFSSLSLAEHTIPSNHRDVELAYKNKVSATVQIKFSSILFDQTESPISQIYALLPLYFSNLKLNTIGRDFHSTLLYLDNFSLDEVLLIRKLFASLDPETLAKYELDKEVQVLDFENIELTIHGTNSKFLAVKPHREFIQWQVNFWRFVRDHFPEIAERHTQHGNLKSLGEKVFSEDAVHMSLVQWGKKAKIHLTSVEENAVAEKVYDLISELVQQYYKEHGKFPELKFSLKDSSLDLITAPSSIQNSPVSILTYKLDKNGNPGIKDIVRWKATSEGSEDSNFVEFKISKDGLLVPSVSDSSEFKDVIGESKTLPKVDLDRFSEILSQIAKEAFEIAINRDHLSPTKHPAVLQNANIERQNRFFLTNMHHPNLAPERSFEILEKARQLSLKSTDQVALGVGVYASSLQGHVLNPADIDLVINSIVKIPDTITSIEEAEKFAAENFSKDVFKQLRKMALSKKIALSEMRIGSEYTLGITKENTIKAREENPYLTHWDFLNGNYTDKNGKTRTISEMIYDSKDFIKGKADLFNYDSNGKVIGRTPLSLQFLIGFTWKGNNYYLQRNGLKGVPTLMRTAVYDGADSFAVAAAISRAKELYTIQMGDIFPRAIRDLIKSGFGHSESAKNKPLVLADPLWVPKFSKVFLRFLVLLKQNELRLDKYFYEKVKEILVKEGSWQNGYNFKDLADSIIGTINRPEFHLLNLLRRNLNDFSEFNERKQKFTEEQWLVRKAETIDFLKRFQTEIIENPNFAKAVSPELLRATKAFKKVFRNAQFYGNDSASAVEYLKNPKLFSTFRAFEEQLLLLEDAVMTKSADGIRLSQMDKIFIQTLVGYSPHLYHEYLESRAPKTDYELKWDLLFMDVDANPEMIKLYRSLLGKSTVLSRQEFAEIQQKIFKPKRLRSSSCEESLIVAPKGNN